MEIKAIEKLLTCLFIVLMLSADYASVNKVSAEIAPSVTVYGGGYTALRSQYNIYYKPVNFANGLWQGMIDCALTYDIDDKYKGQIPLVCTNPEELHLVMQTTGTVDLPPLGEALPLSNPNCVASVQVWGGNKPGAPFKFIGINATDYEARWVTSVYFTIDTSGKTTDSTPPVITDLTIKNITYNILQIQLRFHVNENILRATYSLDGQDNITITENSTLTDLSVGNHNLIVYAQDEAGNLGTSQTSFTVVEQLNQLEQAAEQQPKPFPAALTAKALLLTLGVVLATLIYFRLYRKSS